MGGGILEGQGFVENRVDLADRRILNLGRTGGIKENLVRRETRSKDAGSETLGKPMRDGNEAFGGGMDESRFQEGGAGDGREEQHEEGSVREGVRSEEGQQKFENGTSRSGADVVSDGTFNGWDQKDGAKPLT